VICFIRNPHAKKARFGLSVSEWRHRSMGVTIRFA
jgi:hypothetical protein